MKKWYIDDVFVRNGKVYDRGYYIREDGFIEWTEPIPNGRTHEFPVSECYHPAGWLSFEPGAPIMVEDGELLGELVGIKVVETIERREGYPVRDEAYLVGRVEDGRYFFAWGSEYPYREEVPAEDIPDGESGISYHATADEALEAMQAAVEAVEVLRG